MPYVEVNTKELFLQYYDEIIQCVHKIWRKHQNATSSAEYMLKQAEVFSENPWGLVLLHIDEASNLIDAFALALVVMSNKPFVEITNLWVETGKGSKLVPEGHDWIMKWAFDKYKCTASFIIVTRKNYKRLIEKFYAPLGYTKCGEVIMREG